MLANALDRSQIRSTLGLDLARYCGAFAYTPDTQPVDLYMNNDYKGTYLLTEKVEIAPGRVEIRDLEDMINSEDILLVVGASEDLTTMYSAMETDFFGIPMLVPFSDGDILLENGTGYTLRMTPNGQSYTAS